MGPFEKIVDQIQGVFKFGGRFDGLPDRVPPGGEEPFPESVPTRFETVATPLRLPCLGVFLHLLHHHF